MTKRVFSIPTSFENILKGGDLDYLVAELAKARAELACAKHELGHWQAEAEELAKRHFGKEIAESQADVESCAALVEGLEEDVRRVALGRFKRDSSNKQVHPAVGIKVFEALDYDAGLALDYAREHVPLALSLNKREWEKAAKVLRPEFVKFSQDPRAYIKSDLSEFVPKAEQEA